jgi:hypothetical protein
MVATGATEHVPQLPSVMGCQKAGAGISRRPDARADIEADNNLGSASTGKRGEKMVNLGADRCCRVGVSAGHPYTTECR